MKKCCLLILQAIAIFFFAANCFAFSDLRTHPNITEAAIKQSILTDDNIAYLQNYLGFKNGLSELIANDPEVATKKISIQKVIMNGARQEDSGTLPPPFFMCTRGYNHFYDPLTQQGLDEWTNLASLDIKILLPAVSYLTPMEKGSSLLLTFIPISEKVNEYYESNVLMHGATS